ncbi:hypothetical protein RHGRI_006309 [Rhododendron griersonianum]|uniref:Uncharacterized protein n=1 Tax=Rhododendron griersonianum TaxID=479676 RepID=A0AAV6KSK8_9ERIC|nr:hypothetical protein RHGRI_006309 [Rhododendron griersonianum]
MKPTTGKAAAASLTGPGAGAETWARAPPMAAAEMRAAQAIFFMSMVKFIWRAKVRFLISLKPAFGDEERCSSSLA